MNRIAWRMVLGVFFLLATSAGGHAASFQDVTVSSGIQFQHMQDPVTDVSDPSQIIGAGAAWFDYNNDGFEDLYATQSNGCNKLFRNNGNGTFTEVALAAGVGACTDISRGVAAADYDNDGFVDIFITNTYGQNRLYRNNGDGTFTEVTVAAGMENGVGVVTNSSSVSWGDYNGDGFLDLYVGNYALDIVNQVCAPNHLWRNNGDGTFTEVAQNLGVAHSGGFVDSNGDPIAGCTLAVAFTDYDGDGDPDLMVVNDFGALATPNLLFRNDGSDGLGGWIFTDVSVQTGMNFTQFGMGIGTGDIDNDGDLDYYQTSIPAHPDINAPNVLALNNVNVDGTFTNIAAAAGVDLATFDVINWGVVFFDADEDGLVDIFVASGEAPPNSPMFDADPQEPLFSFRNNGNLTFTENHAQVGLTDTQFTRGLAMADYDNDGHMDLYLANYDGTNVLYQSPGHISNKWLKVRAVGTVGNRDAIGARVTVVSGGTSQIREIDGGSSFLSMNSKVTHFGLGGAAMVDRVVVRFRSGLTYERRNAAANQMLTITEPVVTIVAGAESLVVNPGETFAVTDVITNQTGVGQTVQKWVDFLKPDGTKMTLRGPLTRVLGPNEVVNGNTTFTLPSGSPPGSYMLAFRVGTHPNQIVHQDFVDVSVP